MKVINSVTELQDSIQIAKQAGKQIVLVPTMGALHEGHLSLVEIATHQENAFVIVSIFVNPTQFGKNEDFDKYPRTLPEDIAKLETLVIEPDVIFTPQVSEVYADGIPERLEPRAGAVGSVFEGVSRPGHFDGMLHIVSWFFRTVQPEVAVFGAKDAQQLYLIKRMVHREFADSIKVIEGPTIREESGLARSSRNRFLSAEGLESSAGIYRILHTVEKDINAGIEPAAALDKARMALSSLSLAKLDYLALVDKNTFRPIDQTSSSEALLLVAVVLDGVRLIDNLTLNIQEPA
jgi:pantoate--beta-alanine ligase